MKIVKRPAYGRFFYVHSQSVCYVYINIDNKYLFTGDVMTYQKIYSGEPIRTGGFVTGALPGGRYSVGDQGSDTQVNLGSALDLKPCRAFGSALADGVSTEILPHGARSILEIYNLSASLPIYLNFGAVATASENSVKILASGSWKAQSESVPTDSINLLISGGVANVTIVTDQPEQ